MTDIYAMTDALIMRKMGEKIRQRRLAVNRTQAEMAADSGVSLSSVKKIEKGEIGTFDSLLRLLRQLNLLDVMTTLVEEDGLTPRQLFMAAEKANKEKRRRASGSRSGK